MTTSWAGYYAAPYAKQQYRYAGFMRRAVAYILDMIILLAGSVTAFLLIEAFTGIRLYSGQSDSNGFSLSLSGWPFLLVSVTYFVWMNANGATVGKKALGIRVTNREGGVPGFRRSLLRSLIPIIGSALPTVLGFLTWFANETGGWYPAFVTGGGAIGLTMMYSLFQLGEELSMIWHEHKQTVHDQMGGTYVIRNP